MTLPASGAISLSQVAVELGRASTATTSLTETAVRDLAGVPSGAISLTDLYGKSAAGPVSQFGGLMSASRVPSSTAATASVTFDTDGSVTGSLGGTITSNGASGDLWYSPETASIGSSYWIRATTSSGQAPSTGTMNTWLQLSTGRVWSYTSGGGSLGTRTGTVLFEISSASGGSPVVCSGSYTFDVYNEQ